jgi:hypothetical protein
MLLALYGTYGVLLAGVLPVIECLVGSWPPELNGKLGLPPY